MGTTIKQYLPIVLNVGIVEKEDIWPETVQRKYAETHKEGIGRLVEEEVEEELDVEAEVEAVEVEIHSAFLLMLAMQIQEREAPS